MSEELLDLFAYDASTPLRLSLVEREEREGTPVPEIRFDNGAGGDVEAFVVGEPGRYREARLLYEAAAEPKTWSEHGCGHGVDGYPPARAERAAFLERVLHLS